MRLFLAINLPHEVRREIVAAATTLRASAPDLSWVGETGLHLTLKFLGEVEDERVPDIEAALAAVAGRHRELLMSLSGVGAFPNFRKARVVWLGVGQDPRLELLHHDVEVACEKLGFEVEGRAFRPHLTLARIKHPLSEDRLRVLARAARQTDYRTDFIIRSVDLMHSELSPRGSTYTTVMSAALRSS
ncbi:MAG TPA: RNA 2',3'-cyclic phosphodiesterase [Gemmatimonadaceae bacterium]|nr:RNA 2',3'-cyclic phosphodiesterase [Gemmatimonadaceae bacterium]